jgi:hypothetical protein
MASSYTPLESGYLSTFGSIPTFSGSGGSFYSSVVFVYLLFFAIIVVAAGGRYVVAGLSRMQAGEQGLRKSNEIIKRVTLGLLGVFGLFILLYTINRGFLVGDIGLEGLRIGGGAGTTQTTPTTPTNTTGGQTTQGGTGQTQTQTTGTEAAIRADLAKSNITVNKNACTQTQTSNCTNVAGLPQSTIDMLKQLKTTCNQSFVVTGGTEGGHSSHGVGLRPVDVTYNNGSLNSCIFGFTAITPPKFCYRAYQNFGYTFCDERNTNRHWHIY